MNDFWNELHENIEVVRRAFTTHGIRLKTNEGLSIALGIAEDTANNNGNKAQSPFDAQQASESILVVFSLSANIQQCLNSNVNIRDQIRQIVTGTMDYGTPAKTGNSTIYFKDFEFEIFLISELLRKGLEVELLETGDPLGEMLCEGIVIEAKHPNSLGQLSKLAKKFNNNLKTADKLGIFAIALEDVYELGDVKEFEDSQVYNSWLALKHEDMTYNNAEILKVIDPLDNIAAVVFTTSKLLKISNEIRFQRLSNALIFDNKLKKNTNDLDVVIKVARTFNPNPVLYSEVWNSHLNSNTK